MNNQKERNFLKIVLIIGLISGIIFRLAPFFIVGAKFPFRYGGLFLDFAQQIKENHYALPVFIPFYTDNGIPFAYPPVPFYIEAFLIYDLFIPKFLVVNLLPPFISVLSIFLFTYFVKQLGIGKIPAIVSVLAFAMVPFSFAEAIEGGGLSESFGCFFIILLALTIVQARKTSSFRRIILIGISWALCILGSPGSAYASVPMMLVFTFLYTQTNKKILLHKVRELFFTLIIAAAISSPYWLAVIRNHGYKIFLVSFIAQHSNNYNFIKESLSSLFTFNWASNTLWDMLIIIGFIVLLLHRKWFLVAWFSLFALIPRESTWLIAFPAALLVGVGAYAGLKYINKSTQRGFTLLRSNILLTLFLGMVLSINLFIPPIYMIQKYVNEHQKGLTEDFMDMASWVNNNLPDNGDLIVISTPQVLEWSPIMTRRTVLNVPYGTEFEPNKAIVINDLNSCIDGCNTIICVSQCGVEDTRYKSFFVIVQRDYWKKFGLIDTKLMSLWENPEYIIIDSK